MQTWRATSSRTGSDAACHVQVLLLPAPDAAAAGALASHAMRSLQSAQPGQHILGTSLLSFLLPHTAELSEVRTIEPTAGSLVAD